MNWCWFAELAAPAAGTLASAEILDLEGRVVGELAAWAAGRKPVADAVRMDARVVDPSGSAAWVSFVLLSRDCPPLFDDPAVSGAMRSVFSYLPPDAVSTLVRDSSHFAGAITVRRDGPADLRADPFARLGPARVLRVGPGLFGRTAPVPGPGIQRYNGKPWPAPGF